MNLRTTACLVSTKCNYFLFNIWFLFKALSVSGWTSVPHQVAHMYLWVNYDNRITETQHLFKT